MRGIPPLDAKITDPDNIIVDIILEEHQKGNPVYLTMIRNHEMLNPVQHDDGAEFSVTLVLFPGLMNTETSVLDYGLWSHLSKQELYSYIFSYWPENTVFSFAK